MKKIFYGLLMLLILSGGSLRAQIRYWKDQPFWMFDYESPGKGTSSNPILIEVSPQLAYLADLVNKGNNFSGKYFKLVNDIDLGLCLWTPIGIYGSGIADNTKRFCGIFDGNGKTIKNVIIDDAASYQGLFGITSASTVIKNLTVEGVWIITTGSHAGGLVGYNTGTVTDCSVKPNPIDPAGYYPPIFDDLAFFFDFVKAASNAGGLAGYNTGSITGCFVKDVRTTIPYTPYDNEISGGLVGYNAGNIADCNVESAIMAQSNLGGFTGTNGSTGTISRCSAVIEITGSRNHKSYGGFIGSNSGTVSDCHAAGNITGDGSMGGFVHENTGTISKCYANVNVAHIGHIITAIGGFVWRTGNGSVISDCCAYGNVISGHAFAGGFVVDGVAGSISRCFATGNVKGIFFIGGFATDAANISDCYATGSVTGLSPSGLHITGAFAGRVYGNISRCYASGVVGGDPDGIFGGFVGISEPEAGYTSCYFDIQGTGLKSGGGNVKNIGNVTGTAVATLTSGALPPGFNATVWQTAAGYYPQLKSFAGSANAKMKTASALSVVPFIPANSNERADSVCTAFRVTDKTAANETVAWSVAPAATADIVDGTVSSKNVAAWDTLTLKTGNIKRTMNYRPRKAFNASTIKITAGSQIFDLSDEEFRLTAACNEKGTLPITVTASSLNNITIDNEPIRVSFADLSKPGVTKRIVKMTGVDGVSKEYKLTVERPFTSEDNIFEQRWQDVLAVNNNSTTNGGFTFTAYEWYKDGNKLPGTKGYLQEPGGLSKTVKYTAGLTTQQGDKIGTCPATIITSAVKMAAWPNPAQRGQTVRVDTGIPADALGGAVVQLFGPSGNIVAKQNLRDPVAEIAMPDTPGQYLLQVTTTGGAAQTFKIAVE